MIEHTKGVKEKVQAITAQQQAQNQQSAQADVAVARKNQNSRFLHFCAIVFQLTSKSPAYCGFVS